MVYKSNSGKRCSKMENLLALEKNNPTTYYKNTQNSSNLISQKINQNQMNRSSKTENYVSKQNFPKTQGNLSERISQPNAHKSQSGLMKKKDVNATIEYSLNNSGFTNYKPEEIDYYKSKFPENFTQGSPKTNRSQSKLKEGMKTIKLSKVEESIAESASNIKFVDYSGFEGEIKISENCIIEPRKTYNKRYGKTIIKGSTILDQDKLDMEIKKSVVETVNQNMSISEDKKKLRGTYVKKHYRKLNGSNKKKTVNKVIKMKQTRNINIEDLPNASKLDISFDHLGHSRVKMQQILDANGNVIEQDDKVLSSVIISKSQANAHQNMGIQGNLKIVRKIKEGQFSKKPEYEVVGCYTEEKSMKPEMSLDKNMMNESFAQSRIAEEYREAVLARFFNQDTANWGSKWESLERQYMTQLTNAMKQDSEFIENNQHQILEEINNEIIESHKNPEYRSLHHKPSQNTNLTFGQRTSEKGKRISKIENIVKYATQYDLSLIHI